MNSKRWIYTFFCLFFLTSFTFAAEEAPTATPASTPTSDVSDAVTKSTETKSTKATQTHFPQTLTLGDVQWQLANHEEDDNLELAEYVTGGEKVTDWTQLLTFQKFKFAIRKEVTPGMFAQSEIDELNKQKYKVISDIKESTPTEAIMEFRISAPEAEIQDEIQRIIKTPDDKLIVLHYVIKKADMGDAERKKWIENLKKIDLPILR